MEFIKVNGKEYECTKVTTGVNSIAATMEGQEIEAIHAEFKDATELTVSGEDKVTYGIYAGLAFKSAMVDAEGNVTVSFHIKDETEKRIEELERKCAVFEEQNAVFEQTQSEQDDILAELMFGSEE